MSNTYEEVDAILAASLIEGIEENATVNTFASSDNLNALVNALVEAIPPYDCRAIEAHRDAIARQLALHLPKEIIKAPPPAFIDNDFLYCFWVYEGGYSDYRNAFFRNVNTTSAQETLAKNVVEAASHLNNEWWSKYSVTILTDCCNAHYPCDIHSDLLREDIDDFHQAFLSGLTPSYMASFTDGYEPTKDAFQAIETTGRSQEAAQLLDSGISANNFRTNFNAFSLNGGDDAIEAEWFMYNLWVALQALDYGDVDAAIAQHDEEGLIIHNALQPQNWWTGEYNTWYTKANGDIVYNFAKNTMEEDFITTIYFNNGYGKFDPFLDPIPNGYAYSLCYWGALNYYY